MKKDKIISMCKNANLGFKESRFSGVPYRVTLKAEDTYFWDCKDLSECFEAIFQAEMIRDMIKMQVPVKILKKA
jgi:hypothetical protein